MSTILLLLVGVLNDTMRCFSYRIWSTFLALFSLYTCLASLWTYIAPQQALPLFIVDNIINCLFTIDIIATYFVTVDNQNKMAINYFMRTVFHALLSFPYELIGMGFPASSGTFWTFNSLCLLRILRFARVLYLFIVLEKNEKMNYTWVNTAKMISVCCFVIHCKGCIYCYIASFNGGPKWTWIELQRSMFLSESLAERYVDAISWSVVSFTTVGFGDWHLVTFEEKLFTIVCLIHDVAIGVYITILLARWMLPGGRGQHTRSNSTEMPTNLLEASN